MPELRALLAEERQQCIASLPDITFRGRILSVLPEPGRSVRGNGFQVGDAG